MIQRIFIPGSEWLYFKIYTGFKTADELLIRIIYPYVKNLIERRCIDGFFFIRYTDPDFHIRLRLHIPFPENYGLIMHEFHQRFYKEIETGSVVKIICDTYVREIERYGTHTMKLMEELFQVDSIAILDILSNLAQIPSKTRNEVHWQLSLSLLDDALSAFGYENFDKLRVISNMAENYKKEFGFTKHVYTKQLNEKYRAYRNEIEAILRSRKDLYGYKEIFTARREVFGQLAIRIMSTSNNIDIDKLSHSILHMTMNRWFRSKNRLNELVIYEFLNKYYKTVTYNLSSLHT